MYRENPFGNPDGARADLKEVEESFITYYPYGLNFQKDKSNILNKRVIVGAKGSGKTVYLRKIQSILKERAENNPSIYVDNDIEQNLNCTDRVVRFCDFFSRQMLSEKWSMVWQITILLTLTNKLMFNNRPQKYIDDTERNSIVSLLQGTGLVTQDDIRNRIEYSLYSCFQIIIYEAETKNRINRILENRNWLSLRSKLKDLLKTSPEIYLFLDSIDLEYEHAPLHWLMCQKGLFYAVLSFLQEGVLGEKLHLIITLRDNVFTSILRSEHSTKFSSESHVFPLIWNTPNIRSFLHQKVSSLDDCYFIDEINNGKNVSSWLSITNIENEYSKIEDISSFIIRHTRMVPRDVIIVCNELAKLHAELTVNHNTNIPDKIKEIVYRYSKLFGEELLTICAKNIAANEMPNGAGQNDYSDGFTANQYYHESKYLKLKKLLFKHIQTNEFGMEVIENLEKSGEEVFGNSSYIVDVLWQNGVIGYGERNQSVYYGIGYSNDIFMPRNKCKYFLCACVALMILY